MSSYNSNAGLDRVGSSRRARSAGFGLVELMVSLAIGLVLIAALVALFLGTSRNNREMASANSMIENGRFAIQLLENDVVHAGFWGTYVPLFDDATATGVPDDVPTLVPDPCLDYATWDAAYVEALLGVYLQAYDEDEVTAGPVCAGVVNDMSPDSDLLVVRHAETCAAGTAPCAAETNNHLYIQGSLCTGDTARYVLGQKGVDAFPLTRINCTTLAERREYVSNMYYVQELVTTDANGIATTIPTLVRSSFTQAGGTLAHRAPVPLVEGIDAFRVEFGMDSASGTGDAVDYSAAIDWEDDLNKAMATNRGDGIPDDAFVRCDSVTPCDQADLMNVTAVRIYVLARSREPTPGYTDTKEYTLGTAPALGPYNDGFKRHVYTTTVRLPNVSGRRERP
jgi:type IV pilus assembly protein PilW